MTPIAPPTTRRATTRSLARRTTGGGTIHVREFATLDGPFFIAVDVEEEMLIATGWTAMRQPTLVPGTTDWRPDRSLAPSLVERVKAAISGESVSFREVRLAATTPFFAACRKVAQKIPAGSTITYGQLAAAAGSPHASRAAGQAMRRNPVPIVVPCHRVISSSGAIGGFGGAWSSAWGDQENFTGIKAKLLEREARSLSQA